MSRRRDHRRAKAAAKRGEKFGRRAPDLQPVSAATWATLRRGREQMTGDDAAHEGEPKWRRA